MSKFLSEEERKNILLSASRKNKILAPEVKVDVSLDEIEAFGNQESLGRMRKSIEDYDKNLQERIVFINQHLSTAIPFTRQNLYLICAYTGNGKSTIAANITFPLWKQNKKVLVVSNEETEEDVIMRIACLELGINFNSYKDGSMSQQQRMLAMALFEEIAKYVKVIGTDFQKDGIFGFTTKLECIKGLLMSVKNHPDYACVLIDYYQLIKYSLADSSKRGFDVLTDLWIFLGQYIKASTVPVVLFAQLHSTDKRKTKELDGRIKDCPAVTEAATVILEVIPDFNNHTTEWLFHKFRFNGNMVGKKIVSGFENGRYVVLDADHKRTQAEADLEVLKNSLKSNDGDFGRVMSEVKL